MNWTISVSVEIMQVIVHESCNTLEEECKLETSEGFRERKEDNLTGRVLNSWVILPCSDTSEMRHFLGYLGWIPLAPPTTIGRSRLLIYLINSGLEYKVKPSYWSVCSFIWFFQQQIEASFAFIPVTSLPRFLSYYILKKYNKKIFS